MAQQQQQEGEGEGGGDDTKIPCPSRHVQRIIMGKEDADAADGGGCCCFIELRRTDGLDNRPRRLVEAYVAVVEDPRQCGPLLKKLSYALPLGLTPPQDQLNSQPAAQKDGNDTALALFAKTFNNSSSNKDRVDLAHLKRVRKIGNNASQLSTDQKVPSKKKQKKLDPAEVKQNEECGSVASITSTVTNTITKRKHPIVEVVLRDVESMERDFRAMPPSRATIAKTDPPTAASLQSTSCIGYLQDIFGEPQSSSSSIKIIKRIIPGRPPESVQEWNDFKQEYWPTSFFPLKSKEHLEGQLALTLEERKQMKVGMEHAIQDMLNARNAVTGAAMSTSEAQKVPACNDNANNAKKRHFAGAILLDPNTSKVVARATDERNTQLHLHHSRATTVDEKTLKLPSILTNPLATSILLAIQGVSRQERQQATSLNGGMESSEFQSGQYLCTGFDLYTTQEPTVFEAMSLLHSRIRRVVYGCAAHDRATGGGTINSASGIETMHIHALPSTNHHYRAFTCQHGSDIWKKCRGDR